MANKFKIGDRVERININFDDYFSVGEIGTVTKCNAHAADVEYDGDIKVGNDINNLILAEKNMASTSIKEKFALAFKGEPEKSLIKSGLLNIDESLTADGQAIFLTWLLKKNAEAFKKEVAEVILADEEKK